MSYMEYKEEKTPDEVLTRLEKMSEAEPEKQITLTEVGFFDWLNKEAKDGWQMVWAAFRFPYVTLERKVLEDKVLKK